MTNFDLSKLEQIIAERSKATDGSSYTAELMAKGRAECARKLGEEAVETIVAALSGDQRHLVSESADLLFHLLILLRVSEVSLNEVYAELTARTAQSGLTEKAGRRAG